MSRRWEWKKSSIVGWMCFKSWRSPRRECEVFGQKWMCWDRWTALVPLGRWPAACFSPGSWTVFLVTEPPFTRWSSRCQVASKEKRWSFCVCVWMCGESGTRLSDSGGCRGEEHPECTGRSHTSQQRVAGGLVGNGGKGQALRDFKLSSWRIFTVFCIPEVFRLFLRLPRGPCPRPEKLRALSSYSRAALLVSNLLGLLCTICLIIWRKVFSTCPLLFFPLNYWSVLRVTEEFQAEECIYVVITSTEGGCGGAGGVRRK